MSWNGASREFGFRIQATHKELIEHFAIHVRSHFPKALPRKRLKIVAKDAGLPNLYYYQLDFGYNSSLSDVLDLDYLDSAFPGLFVTNKLFPFFTIRVEMIIERTNTNQYSFITHSDFFYFCSPAKLNIADIEPVGERAE